MKIMKKYGVCAVLAAALLTMALVVSCVGPVDTGSGYTPPPAGMGIVQLNFDKNIERTILPEDAKITDFNWFSINFRLTSGPGTGPGPLSPFVVAQGDQNNPFTVNEGTYTIEVIAYLSAGTSEPAAVGEVENVPVSNSQGATPSITLKAYDPDDADGDGTFSFAITNSVTYTWGSAGMVITPIGGGGAPISHNFISDGWADSIDLEAGYYYVDFTLVANQGTTVTLRHVLHIYYNMTSAFTYTIVNGLFGEPVILTGSVTITWIVEAITNVSPILTANKNTGGAAPVDEGDAITISTDKTNTNADRDVVVITLTNASVYDANADWYCNGGTTPIATGVASLSITAGTTAPFTVEGTTYHLTVIGEKDGIPYSTYIFIDVTE